MSKRILLGLSGGVDSAVAAYLLKQQAYDVTCCFMRNWDSLTNNDILGNPDIAAAICPQEQDYNDAVKVAEILGLPLLRVDFIKEYWEEVFSYFLAEYQKGRTPNPDIMCNKYIKFAHFLDYAEQLGFAMIATGHYAKTAQKGKQHFLLKAYDGNKDQSYFLAQISPKALSRTLFPLGEMPKEEVRKIALKLKLPIANKRDSTGICFIGERHFRDFLHNYIPAQVGEIYDLDYQEAVGQHSGALYYTIGQRKGLSLGGRRGPYFVVGKNVAKNIVYVSGKGADYWLTSDSCRISDCNFFNEVTASEITAVKFRYRQKDTAVQAKITGCEVVLQYQGTKAVTLGQQAVFYNGDYCLGGGTIAAVYKDGKSLDELIKERVGF